MEKNFEQFYEIVRRIPPGRVCSYGQIAKLSGNHRWARLVGHALSRCTLADVPCHRVVNAKGELCDAFMPLGKDSQRLRLEMEGVEFLPNGCVNMKAAMWYG